MDKDLAARQEARELARQAEAAQQTLKACSQEQLDRMAQAISRAFMEQAESLGRMACEETGFGNPADKAEKNRFAAGRVWEAIRDLKTVGLLREDREKKLWELGVPVGVIAAIVPSTNPTSTVCYKAMIALKAGCAIVFSPHPSAARCTQEAVRIAARAAREAGCPAGAVSCLENVTMEATNELMTCPQVRLILATGGPGMVKAAYSSGKPAIGVGAGNGPAYIHPSADLPKAVSDILRSKTFDNGTICASEQSIIVETSNARAFQEEAARQGAYFLSREEAGKVARVLFRPDGRMNPKVVGRTAQTIGALAGIQIPQSARVLVARETEAGPTRPYSMEKLCPVLAYYVEENQDSVLRKAIAVLSHEGAGHSFMLHARDESVIRRFAQEIPVSRFLVNTPGALGGIGATTNLFPALTLGCGAVGGSSSSNNIGPTDLINIRRVAWGVRDMAPARTAEVSEDMINALTAEIMRKLM
ncbi:MAG: acetaldehyde dehydrogenase (acetylating) [Clostridiales bacterium]|nr:acetaldehyde dehydrogenase (acetylating) [Clostridiales bacterium]